MYSSLESKLHRRYMIWLKLTFGVSVLGLLFVTFLLKRKNYCEKKTVIICENEVDQVISCRDESLIKIVYANFGRTVSDTEICPWKYGRQNNLTHNNMLNCYFPKSYKQIKRFCDDEQRCTLQATSSFAGNDPCPGTYKYLEVTYYCARMKDSHCINIPREAVYKAIDSRHHRYSKSSAGQLQRFPGYCKPQTTIVCEGGRYEISCPEESTIRIIAGNYGRTHADVCPLNRPHENRQDCINVKSERKIQQQCDGSNSCIVSTDSNVYTPDSCTGTKKYLLIIHYCETNICQVDYPPLRLNSDNNQHLHRLPRKNIDPAVCRTVTIVVCENKPNIKITCPINSEVRILFANYGRMLADNVVCPYKRPHNNATDCVNYKSESTIKSLCEGKQECVVGASNDFFGSDPCYGTYKYLQVVHFCKPIGLNSCKEMTPVSQSGTLFDQVSRQNSLVFQKTNRLNGQVNQQIKMDIQGDTSSFNHVNRMNNQQSQVIRQISVHSQNLRHDQHIDTCTPETTIICEGHKEIEIECPANTVLKVISANYGRTHSDNVVCPYGRSHDNRIDCINPESKQKIKSLCDGSQICVLRASNDVYGWDPCVGTYKYVHVVHYCQTMDGYC